MKLNHKITIDLLEFIRSGKFDYIRLGKTKEWILNNFADPDELDAFPEIYKEAIWHYGNLEFHFDGNDLFLIFSDYIDTLNGGESLKLQTWIFSEPEKLNLAYVINHFTILNSGVALSFSPEDGMETGTNPNDYKLDSISLMRH